MKYFSHLSLAILALVPAFGLGQQVASLNEPHIALNSTGSVHADSPAASSSINASSATAPREPLVGRWLDLDTLSHSERYRNAYNQGGFRAFQAGQQRNLIVGRFKMDRDARFYIGFRASSGRYFNWSYAEFAGESRTDRLRAASLDGEAARAKTPAENAEQKLAKAADPAGVIVTNAYSNGWEFYLRELYIGASPVKAATVEFGSFGIEHGYASEITTYDNDGYLTGERAFIEDPKHLFFDRIEFTNAFFGFISDPNLFDRGSGFTSSNYRQIMAKKQLNKRIGFSTDYTSLIGTNTLRQAAYIGTQESKIVDHVRLETYQRLNAVTLQGLPISGGAGGAVTADKSIGKRVVVDAGFGAIDENYTVYGNSRYLHSTGYSTNGDTFGLGNRPFVHAWIKMAPGVTAFGYYTHAVGSGVAQWVLDLNKQGFYGGMSFDLKNWVNTKKAVL